MRCIVMIFLLSASAMAQREVAEFLSHGLEASMKNLPPVPQQDRDALLDVTAALLSKHLTFRPDGTVSALCTHFIRQHVEWKQLVVQRISARPVSDVDRLNGITRRYFMSFSCDGHRTYDNQTSTWSEWHPGNYPRFTAGIDIDWKNGVWTPNAEALKDFAPGPGPSIVAPDPASKAAGLPAGMMRSK